jgi:lipoprotein-releasing system permease protein
LLGRELAGELALDVGDRLIVVLPSGQENIYSISGLYDVGTASVNKSWVITRLETAQDIFGYGNRVTAIDVTVDDLFLADAVAAQIRQDLDTSQLKVENWKQLNQDLLNALQSQRLSSFMIQAFILLSVVIAISSILAITVFQKSRQIRYIKSNGYQG